LYQWTEGCGAGGCDSETNFDGRQYGDLPGVPEKVTFVVVESVDVWDTDNGSNAGTKKRSV